MLPLLEFSGSESSIKVNYHPTKTGIYYVLTSVYVFLCVLNVQL